MIANGTAALWIWRMERERRKGGTRWKNEVGELTMNTAGTSQREGDRRGSTEGLV